MTGGTGSYDPAKFEQLTFHDRVAGFRDGTDSPRAYLERCLEAIDTREPEVKAWVATRIENAREEADEATLRYRRGTPASSIDGMPIGIKDLIMTRDLPTGMGSPAYDGAMTFQDSPSVRALRDAGAVVVGKLVTTEFGGAEPGPTTNPFDPTRSPGGSSSGSAAAVASHMVPAALGTQVGGSVIRPAAYCGNVALKPTYGAFNRGERQWSSQSAIGVHAGSFVDMWHVSIEMSKRSGGDAGHPGLYGGAEPAPPARPNRLVVLETEGWGLTDGASKSAFEQLIGQLEASGVQILRRGDHELIEEFETATARSGAITDVIVGFETRWSMQNTDERSPGMLSERSARGLEKNLKLTVDDYRVALAGKDAARLAHRAIAPLADAVLALSCPGPAPSQTCPPGVDPLDWRPTGSAACNVATSVLGSPAVTVPMMAVDGLPVGVQLIGQWHQDERITGYARWLADSLSPVAT